MVKFLRQENGVNFVEYIDKDGNKFIVEEHLFTTNDCYLKVIPVK